MFGFPSFRDLADRDAVGMDKVPLGSNRVVDTRRGGIVPAYRIALYTHISIMDLPAILTNQSAKGGSRTADSARLSAMYAQGILLIDDVYLAFREMLHPRLSEWNASRRPGGSGECHG